VPSEQQGLVVEALRVDATGPGVDIVDEIGFAVPPGTALGIVGESGSGKTTVAMALLGFARPGTHIASGHVRIGELDILALDERELRTRRGRLVSYVPQNPAGSLSPGMRVRDQLEEIVAAHLPSTADLEALIDAAWTAAQLPAGRDQMQRYPHQLSGGQQQRVAIAMALVCRPAVIVMDEPTTGLDVLTQERLLDVIRGVRERRETSIVYISHDLGVVRNLVDDVVVMYGGRIVESGPVDALFRDPQHPYTRRLLEAIPRVRTAAAAVRGIPGHAVEPWNRPAGCPFAPRCEYRVAQCGVMPPRVQTGFGFARCWRVGELGTPETPAHSPARLGTSRRLSAEAEQPLLDVGNLVAGYRRAGALLRRRRRVDVAVDDVSFELAPGACLALVGESGSGKTTLARCLAGLHEPISGTMRYRGLELPGVAGKRHADLRRRIQIVFQDPDSSLNPSMTVGSIVRRPLEQFFHLGRREQTVRLHGLLERVHLPPSMATRLPRELSGGEKQRVAIARALAAEPELLICDEVTSALDVAVQASILELLSELRASARMSLLFVTHDLAVVRTISDAVLVMSNGSIRERGDRESIFTTPNDDYTRRLLDAAPDLNEGDYPGHRPPVGTAGLAEAGLT
jgi:peptide/nickel transport system ATP-binding protein